MKELILSQFKKYLNKKELLEYVRTIFVSLLISLILAGVATGCSKIIAEHHSKMLAKMTNTAKDNELIVFLISKYKEKEKEYPGDYTINVRLGGLYELLFNYNQAEVEYKNAINKSPYGVYTPYFGLANLYIKKGQYKKALAVVKKIDNKDYKPLLVAKGDFYMNLGDALWAKSRYEDAVKQYKIAFFYYKKVDSHKKELAISGIVDCYNKIADNDFQRSNYSKSIDSLETALLYKKTPFIYYKLAILYKNIDVVKANKYMEKTYAADPGLINYNIYEEILIKLINHYYVNGKDIEKELYMQKLKSVRSFQKKYVIADDDIHIDIVRLKYKSNLFKTKYTLKYQYKIENKSKYDINYLHLITKLTYTTSEGEIKHKKIDEQKLFSKDKPLKSRNSSGIYSIVYKYDDNEELFTAEKIDLEFYAGKKDNMRKIPIHSVEIKAPTNNQL